MKSLWKIAGQGIVVSGILWAGVFVTGCGTPVFSDAPVAGLPDPAANIGTSDKFRTGDAVAITFSGTSVETPLIKDYMETIKEDGTITPPFDVGSIAAAGKTPGELQNELRDKYNALFKHMTVTVQSNSRFYYVIGEVRKPGPEPYLGQTDIIKAISAAGDFTDFANKKKVRLTRADGRTEEINVLQAIDDPQYDVPVYPGDKVVVKRRLF